MTYLPLHLNGLSNPGLDVVLESRIYRRGQYVLLPGHRIEPPKKLLPVERNMMHVIISSRNACSMYLSRTTRQTRIRSVSLFLLSTNRGAPSLTISARRTTHDPHVAVAHDETSSDTQSQVARLRNAERQALDRTGQTRFLRQLYTQFDVSPRCKTPDDMPPEKFLHSMIGYHLACENSLCGMAMTQGVQRRVINIGLGIKQIAVEPRGTSVSAYLESLSHKVGGARPSKCVG